MEGGPYNGRTEAVTAWNRRVLPTKLLADKIRTHAYNPFFVPSADAALKIADAIEHDSWPSTVLDARFLKDIEHDPR